MVQRALLALTLLAVSTGCLGTGALGGKVRTFNLTAVENRWGREGLFLGLQVLWVYRLCTIADLFILNSIEFWSGTNPVNGRSPLVDVPPSEVEKIGLHEIDEARVALVGENAAELHVGFRNGDRMTFDVLREGERYTVSYQGRVFFEGRIDPAVASRNARP